MDGVVHQYKELLNGGSIVVYGGSYLLQLILYIQVVTKTSTYLRRNILYASLLEL